MRGEDIFYAAAVAILLAWLVFSTGITAPHRYRAPLDSPALRSAPVTLSPADPPRVVAELTVDSDRFYILVGDGPPSFSVAVSASD